MEMSHLLQRQLHFVQEVGKQSIEKIKLSLLKIGYACQTHVQTKGFVTSLTMKES